MLVNTLLVIISLKNVLTYQIKDVFWRSDQVEKLQQGQDGVERHYVAEITRER